MNAADLAYQVAKNESNIAQMTVSLQMIEHRGKERIAGVQKGSAGLADSVAKLQAETGAIEAASLRLIERIESLESRVPEAEEHTCDSCGAKITEGEE